MMDNGRQPRQGPVPVTMVAGMELELDGLLYGKSSYENPIKIWITTPYMNMSAAAPL